MNALIKKLGIDETYTEKIKNIKWDKVKQNTFNKGGYNQMADLLFLPKTKEGYNYLLCVCDLWSDLFDIEPVKNKEPETVLKAIKTIYKRKPNYLKEPVSSLRTDSGTEFQGVFHRWFFDENIFHRVGNPNRHQQLGNVEQLNYVIARLLNGYMNTNEKKSGKVFKEWNEILSIIRKDLNEIRQKPDGDPFSKLSKITKELPKFKVGDVVYYKLDTPQDALGHNQPTKNFRVGDYRFDLYNPRKIVKILYYPKNIRYLLNGKNNVSYAQSELKLAPQKEETYTIKEIIGKRKIRGNIEYLVHWKGYLKKDATWEAEELLKEDAIEAIFEYEAKNH
jgi:hypothetical protein